MSTFSAVILSSKFYILPIFCFLLVAGCQDSSERDSLLGRIEQLRQERTQLQADLKQSNSNNKQLKKQVQVLSGLPEDVRLESLYRLQSVMIHRYTGLVDKDEDGKMEQLVAHVQPIDEEGDVIKAAGTANVQLWDLNKTNGEALLGQWNIEVNELKKRWVTFLVTNFRLTLDLEEKIEPPEEPLTVKLIFTDYLSGRVFNEQRVVEPAEP